MKYWLLKSEPDVWSIDQQKRVGFKGAMWEGVRNYQACNNLKQMKLGDMCFFYHSNIGKEIVGIVKVIKEAFLDPTDKKKRFVAIQVRFEKKFNKIMDDIPYATDQDLKECFIEIHHVMFQPNSRTGITPIHLYDRRLKTNIKAIDEFSWLL